MVERHSEIERSDVFKIENVPILKQRHTNWCGYTSLSMQLQYQGYSELTPEVLFRHMNNGEYDENKEKLDPSRGPSIGSLALATEELTSLKVDLFDEKIYDALQQRKSDSTPYSVLNAYIIGRKAPCMIRTVGHFVVITGVDRINNRYIFNGPRSGIEQSIGKESLDRLWSSEEQAYPDKSTRYLMLALHKQK